MTALLIPLAKGFLSLMGASSLMFFSVKRNIDEQVQMMEIEGALLEAEAEAVEEALELKVEIKPVKPDPVVPEVKK